MQTPLSSVLLWFFILCELKFYSRQLFSYIQAICLRKCCRDFRLSFCTLTMSRFTLYSIYSISPLKASRAPRYVNEFDDA